MVSLQPIKTESEFEDDRPWLVAANRRQNATVTLDVAAFRTANLVTAGRIPSGIEIVLDETTGLAEPAPTTAPADGESNYGVTFVSEPVAEGQTRAVVAALRSGSVRSEGAPRPFIGLPATILLEG